MTLIKEKTAIEFSINYPDIYVISYPFNRGGQLADRSYWLGEINGLVEDYNYKDALIYDSEKQNMGWVVLRMAKNKRLYIMESNGVKILKLVK